MNAIHAAPSLLILIPARNEAAAVGAVVAGCRAFGAAVWVLDDASSDATARVAAGAGAEVKRYADHPLGKTSLLRHALRELRSAEAPAAEWIGFLDGDGQHDPADLPRFWGRSVGTDMVVGDRMGDAAGMPWVRRWTNRAMSALLRMLFGGAVADTQCGFRLVRRAALGSWLPRGRRYEFETEIYIQAQSEGWRTEQVAIEALYRGEGSGISWPVDTLRFVRCLW
ncbi:MAG: glycosyltransferase family 2 protein [Verrucomicrobiota bacterium]